MSNDATSDADGDHRYRSISQDPRELRPRAANRTAALSLVAAIVITVALIALFS